MAKCFSLSLSLFFFFSFFSEELFGMPPEWEVEFTIYLTLGSILLSKASYWIASKKLLKLKAQI